MRAVTDVATGHLIWLAIWVAYIAARCQGIPQSRNSDVRPLPPLPSVMYASQSTDIGSL